MGVPQLPVGLRGAGAVPKGQTRCQGGRWAVPGAVRFLTAGTGLRSAEGSHSEPPRGGGDSRGRPRGGPGSHTLPVTGGGRCGGAASSPARSGMERTFFLPHPMSKAPQGVFQEELKWCISQLEADLHLTPPPKPVEETQHILKVLRSPETPLAKKQQVMSDVFGDYCLSMAEGQESMEKAGMKPGALEVQPSSGQAADGMKQSDPSPEAKPELFTSSGSSFRFDFTLSETNPGADPGDSRAVTATKQESWNGALRFAASGQEPKFAFNFAIPDEDCPQLQLLPSSQHTDPSLPAEAAALPRAAAVWEPEVTQAAGSAPKEDRSHVTSKILQPETAPADEAATVKSTDEAAQKKKKKKKQKPPVSKTEREETETSRKAKTEAKSCQNTNTSHHDEKTSQSDEQLQKELDWCVQQLELGLKTQKPTPKQAEEALRAIRTLRSDKAPLVKKRQLMRAMFGDYRKKVQEELCRELKLMETAAKTARIVEVKGSIRKKNGKFIRKCSGACRKSQGSAGFPSESPRTLYTGLFNDTASKEEFRFNFF